MSTNETTNPTRPIIIESTDDLDMLGVYDTVRITTKQLREGMVMVDELGTPCATLDHRIGSRSGCVEWMVEDLDGSGPGPHWYTTTFAVSRVPNVPVAVA